MEIAKFFEHDLKNGDFELFNKNGNAIYYEKNNGYWSKREYNKNGNEIYYENSNDYWAKSEYDKNGNEIYYENSRGTIVDNRPKTCIDKEILIDGKKYKLVEREE